MSLTSARFNTLVGVVTLFSLFILYSSSFYFLFLSLICRAMDLLVPYIVEGRSELRYPSRVNCKTHSVFGLQNTLLTERIKHLIDHDWDGGCAWLRVVWTSLHTYFMCGEREILFLFSFSFILFLLIGVLIAFYNCVWGFFFFIYLKRSHFKCFFLMLHEVFFGCFVILWRLVQKEFNRLSLYFVFLLFSFLIYTHIFSFF